MLSSAICRRRFVAVAWLSVAANALSGPVASADDDRWSPENLGVTDIPRISAPVDGVVGVDGRVWSISQDGLDLFRISTRTSKGVAVRRPAGLRALPDQGQVAVDGLGRVVVPTRSRLGSGLSRTTIEGKSTVVLLPKSKAKMGPSGITDLEAGPDGSVWFATAGVIGRVNTQGKVFAWKVPTGRQGYPNANRPRIAIDRDGRAAFTALNGIGLVSANGKFSDWKKVSNESSTNLSFLVRGGDDHLWATGGINDDRFYREESPGVWSQTVHFWSTERSKDVFFEALAADPNGMLAIGATSSPDDELHEWDQEWFIKAGLGTGVLPQEDPFIREDGRSPLYFSGLGPALWDGIAASPRRLAIVSLPDGRIWVSLRDWDGWESYNKQRGTRRTPPGGTLVGLRVKRRGRVVSATARCVGPTTGWCTGTLKTSFKGDVKRASLVIPAGPEAVRSTRTASVRLLKGQAAVLNRGRGKLVARVGSFKKRLK